MVEINPGLTIWTFIIFIILLALLAKMGWKPLLASVKSREQAIADSLQRAEQARADAERMIAANQRERARAEEETQIALREGREYAERMRADLVAVDLASRRTAGGGATAETVVFAASAVDVTDLIVDGVVVVKDRHHGRIDDIGVALRDAIDAVTL